MDADAFFDTLYSQFCVHFPCYALYGPGVGFRSEPADDDTASLVLFTDEDLIERYLKGRRGKKPMPVGFHDPVALSRVLDRLPRKITHVTFDPAARVHRRYPLHAVRESLARAATEV